MAFRTKNLFEKTTKLVRSYSSDKIYTHMSLTLNEQTGIATLELAKPPVNSMSFGFLSQLAAAVQQSEADKYKGLIITSRSSGVFSAGLDLKELHHPDSDRILNYLRRLQDVWFQLYDCSTPTAAVINGHSIAGGCLLALSCEYRVMVNSFKIGMNEALVGVPVSPMFIACMQSVIGQWEAEKALLVGRLFTSEEALGVGLVDEVVGGKSEGVCKAEGYLAGFREVSARARGLSKRYLRQEVVRDLVRRREEDVKKLVEIISSRGVQDSLGEHLERMKNKK
ncbi:unnamed protein product [Phaedon cochleariae]|uniref:Enoyl-CoA delta isomerase 1, mitochondrial n=1 Tax=Phaedon cochleariae TaxID=80249 RepID=A0A9P0GR56_PHACE|nr:unnamed protein product [Phaedon cochleariae]